MASAKKERSGLHGLEQLPEKLGRSGVAASRVGLDHHAPNRHDTGSTTARSVDEVALIRNTISHYAPMLIRTLSIPRVPLRGMNFFNGLASPALRQSRCGDRRAEPSRQLSGIIFIDTALGSVRTTRGVT
jgi:hypothetical protein